jgi:hypothetical protein
MRSFGLCLALACVACDDGYADVSGEYTLAITNGDNGCMFANWTVGAESTGIPLTITQTDDHVTAEIGGFAGAYVEVILGSRIFTGKVSGSDVSMRLVGTTMASQGTCDYSVDAIGDARLSGDALNGTITYTAVTDGSNECGSLSGCETRQSFSGARPPAQ